MAEGLRRALKEAVKSKGLKGIGIGNSSNLLHLLSVDDILILCERFRREAAKLKEILDLFCVALSMQVNLEKSSISISRVANEDQVYISTLFQFNCWSCKMA